MSKSNRHQTHLKKKISDSTTGKYQNNENHIVTAQHETDENNSKHNTPYPFNKERNISNTISIQTVTKICRKRENEIEKAKPIPLLDDLNKK